MPLLPTPLSALSDGERRPSASVRKAAAVRHRARLVSSALRLSVVTIGWNGASGLVALVLSVLTGSLALAGFALSALLDSSASVVLVWRFRHERENPLATEQVERRAQTFIEIAMGLVALFVGTRAVHGLLRGSHTDESDFGMVLALLSLLVLPLLARRKLQVAAALPSAALRGDGVLTFAAAALAAVTLLALVVVSAFGWWWADPAAALLIALALGMEAIRVAVRHRFG
jgi:divalent metal cation (Fe/Co/Zn/Cd) transporter